MPAAGEHLYGFVFVWRGAAITQRAPAMAMLGPRARRPKEGQQTMFLVCGEALMDVFVTGETPGGMTLDARVGGSPFNVAMGLARLGQRVALFTGLSQDFLGERLLRAMVAEGIDTSVVQRLSAPTSLGLVALNSAGVPSYAFYGEGAADRALQIGTLQAVPAGMTAIHLGSYATVTDPVATTLRRLVLREHHRSTISYDPNVRLNVEPDLGRWRDTLQWMLSRTQLLKISEEDLGLLMPDAVPHEFARAALAQGVALVVVTRGAEGALGWTSKVHARAEPVQVKVIDTVGAGDTFQAALLTWLAEHERLAPDAMAALTESELADALAFAARAAAITCSRRGADLPRRKELR
jgi:fructokinase